VNQPVTLGTMAGYASTFGPVMPRKYDMGTQVATAVQQGAANFRCVRVTDGTDTAANYALFYASGAYPMELVARSTGTTGNKIGVVLSAGSQAGTWRLTLILPGLTPELFDNIAAPTPAAFWSNLVSAVNTGASALRGPSQLVVASLGTATTTAPQALSNQTLFGGTDGASGVNAATLVGQDTLPRRGLYALRGQGCSLALLADADDDSQYSIQAQFALSEGLYLIATTPSGDTLANAITAKQAAGLDCYGVKLMFGDWVYWNDQTNGTIRLVSPQGFAAGRLANLSPEQSSLNKQLYGIIGTQKSGTPGSGQTNSYSSAELAQLLGNGIDVIANPQPGGTFWGVRGGHNSSSNAATNGDNYTRMTNYLASTLAAGMGLFVGQVINSRLFQRIRATQLSFLQNLLSQGILGSTDGSLPFSVVCDTSNNPNSRTSLGYVQSDAQVQYQAINEKFIVNIEGGQTVQVNRQTLPTGQVGT
jgi:phage tail sheath protein FI